MVMSKEITFRAVKPRDPYHQDALHLELNKFLDSSDPDDTIVITYTRMYEEGK